jgi:hypothetical protein
MVGKCLGLGPKTMYYINEKHCRAWRSLMFWREVSPGGEVPDEKDSGKRMEQDSSLTD